MKLGEKFRSAVLKEWQIYSIDNDALNDKVREEIPIDETGVRILLKENVGTFCTFFKENVSWATALLPAMENEISQLEPQLKAHSEHFAPEDDRSDLIKDYLGLKKRIFSFNNELSLLLEFLDLNKSAVARILEELDRRLESSARATDFDMILSANPVLNGCVVVGLKAASDSLLHRMQSYWPLFQDEWTDKIILTGGCFDLFHRGHRNLLAFLRELGGKRLVATVVGDETYFHLKQKLPIDNFETRKANVLAFVDEVIHFSSTSSDHRQNWADSVLCFFDKEGIEASNCVAFTSDEHADGCTKLSKAMSLPIITLPRTERCSSTLIRATYHQDQKSSDPSRHDT